MFADIAQPSSSFNCMRSKVVRTASCTLPSDVSLIVVRQRQSAADSSVVLTSGVNG
jgi:hypothetical protein